MITVRASLCTSVTTTTKKFVVHNLFNWNPGYYLYYTVHSLIDSVVLVAP